MGHIFLGHGSLSPEGYSYNTGMGTIAVPPGTSLQFFCDTGQGLVVTTKLLIDWNELQRPWPALTSANVTYNLGLGPFSDLKDSANKLMAIMQGGAMDHTIHIPGTTHEVSNDELLCTGTAGQCPTDPREQRAHSCNGILGRFSGDLYWIACTSVVLPRDEEMRELFNMSEADVSEIDKVIAAARGDAPESAVLGADPDSVLAAALRLLDNYDTARQFHAFYYVMVSEEQRQFLSQNQQIAAWIRDNPL